MDPTKKLIVPEINAAELTKEDKIMQIQTLNDPNGFSIGPLHKNTILRESSFHLPIDYWNGRKSSAATRKRIQWSRR
jgi:hypothetical protein